MKKIMMIAILMFSISIAEAKKFTICVGYGFVQVCTEVDITINCGGGKCIIEISKMSGYKPRGTKNTLRLKVPKDGVDIEKITIEKDVELLGENGKGSGEFLKAGTYKNNKMSIDVITYKKK